MRNIGRCEEGTVLKRRLNVPIKIRLRVLAGNPSLHGDDNELQAPECIERDPMNSIISCFMKNKRRTGWEDRASAVYDLGQEGNIAKSSTPIEILFNKRRIPRDIGHVITSTLAQMVIP